jgi:hypothetical protein
MIFVGPAQAGPSFIHPDSSLVPFQYPAQAGLPRL